MLLHIRNEQVKHKLGNVFGEGAVRLNHLIQAMDALYTIYNIADLRTNNSANQEISLSAMKVVDNYGNSSLSEEDYFDLRRLIRSF
jgi:N-methylhydantoinase B/oxoprolinase/acetone carboxylase alpha subunit